MPAKNRKIVNASILSKHRVLQASTDNSYLLRLLLSQKFTKIKAHTRPQLHHRNPPKVIEKDIRPISLTPPSCKRARTLRCKMDKKRDN